MTPFLTAQLARLDRRIEREIHRLRARYELSLDEFRGLYVSDQQVDALLNIGLAARAGHAIPTEPVADVLADTDARWSHLVRTFSLSDIEAQLLLIAAAPDLDPKYSTLFAYLNNDVSRRLPNADLARRLLKDATGADCILATLSPAASLRRQRLIETVPSISGHPSILSDGLHASPAVAHWLHGIPPALAMTSRAFTRTDGAQLHDRETPAGRCATLIMRIYDRARACRESLPVFVLTGQMGSGRATAASAIAAMTNRSLLRVDLSALSDDDNLLDELSIALQLDPAVVLLEGFGSSHGEGARLPTASGRLTQAIENWCTHSIVVLRAHLEERWRLFSGSRFLEMACDIGTVKERTTQWARTARRELTPIPESEIEILSSCFALSPGQIRAAFRTARDIAVMSNSPTTEAEHVHEAARMVCDRDLGTLACKVRHAHCWSDLVLPSVTLSRLQDFAAAIRHRHLVYGAWGFANQAATGIGIRALFSGSSGTGKTMAAGIIASESRLGLYKVELSGVLSKYIGETEQNLERIFRAARAANAILFFDEADALLGKRGEVKDARDRYANTEVAYLLQKLDEHDGIVILATNVKRNIDDAFNRRLQYVIDFPRPGDSERERIWRAMFPSQSPLAADIDFGFLAQQFDLTGGEIRNVVLDSAFLAARDGGSIGMRSLIHALAQQMAKQGKTPLGADFRQYQRLLQPV